MWQFNPNEYTPETFSIIPAGDHRVRIADVEMKTFKSGSQGFEIVLDVSGHGGKLWFYLVLDTNDTKKTNQRIGSFFESFNISDFDMTHFKGWIGKIGAVRVKHEEYNGTQSAKAAFCIARKKQEQLPPWKETGNSSYVANAAPAQPNFVPMSNNDDLPFN